MIQRKRFVDWNRAVVIAPEDAPDVDLLDGTLPAEIVISPDANAANDGDEWRWAHLRLAHGGRIQLGSGYPSADEAKAAVEVIRHALPGAPVRVVEDDE